MDPDYELPDTILEEANKRRDKEKLVQIEKAQQKINEVFQAQLETRENQLMEIQNRITCLAKTLHVLRYVLVSNYYNEPKSQIEFTADELKIVDAQARLHPAIKKIINEKELASMDFSTTRTRRAKKRINVLPINEDVDTKTKHRQVKVEPEAYSTKNTFANVPRNRQMLKKLIIIGNISKWMPSENPEDNSTHKWMVYVRGPQDSPRVDDFIKKIVFHLHPSYHPHDVIELTEHPFHLSRRGWGEFPIRCEVHFVSPLNKPVNVIHQLKLDKTYSGRQTLGSETIVQLTLYDSSPTNYLSINDSENLNGDLYDELTDSCNQFEVKLEPITSDIEEPIAEATIPDQEYHVNCTNSNYVLFDHTYSSVPSY